MAVETLTGNTSIDYIIRDFNSAVDGMISFATVNFGPGTSANRLWSNFNSDSFSRTWLELVAFIADIFFFYFDTQATESYLQTATIRSAVRLIASQFGFVPATEQSASVDATFTLSGAGTIPRGFRVASSSGVEFFLTNAIIAGSAGEFTGTVLQGIIKTETKTAIGVQNEEFNLAGPNVIVDLNNINPLDMTPQVTVSGNSYTLVESFIRFNGTDTPAITDSLGNIIGGGGRVFTIHQRPDGTPFIRFGDGIFGRKLIAGENVVVTYRTGGGSQGNIAEETLTNLVDSLSFVSAVTNFEDASGGADEQSIEQLRELIPASLRTLERAVSETDYSDLIIANFSEVFSASTEINKTDPGIDVNIYVVPQGSGIPQITTNTLLSNRITDFVDRRKMVTIQFQLLDAFGIDTLITLEVFIINTASKTAIAQAIQTALTDFFSLDTGGPSEAGIGFAEPILLKDINDLIQNIDGIERFEIKRLTYRPRIQENVFGLLTQYNYSEVRIFPNITESEWLLGAAGQVTESAGSVIFSNPDPTSFVYDSTTGKVEYNFPVDLSGVGPGDLFRNGPGLQEVTEIQTRGDGVGTQEVTKVVTVADEQGVQEVTEVTTRADLNGNLGGTFFTLFDIIGSVAVWFNVASGNSEPSHGALRSIEVPISTNATANSVASAVAGAVGADSKFNTSVSGTAEVTDITCPVKADINDGEYFLINSANDTTEYYAYYDTTGADAVDPSPPGKTRIRINISAAVTAIDVAVATAAALNALADFSAPVPGTATLTVTNAAPGITTDALDFNVSGAFAIVVTTQGANADTVTIVSVDNADLFDTADGNPATGFTFNTTVQGENVDTLGGTYFDIYDDVGPVRVWFDVDNTSSAPATPGGGRLLEVDISANNSANAVASALQTVVDADAKFSASVVNNEVTITDDNVGTRVNAADGANPTGFTITVLTQGADALTLDGKYFILFDSVGSVGFWIDLDNSGTTIPLGASAANRAIEITTITSGMTASQVATEVRAAIDADSEFSAPAPVGNLITVTSASIVELTDSFDGDTGFTLTTTTQGVANNTDFTVLAVDVPNSELFLSENLPVNPVAGVNAGGSIRNGSTTFESFKCFKKTLATATNLSSDSITDNTQDFAILTGTGVALSARVLLDNTQVFIPNQYATGEFYLVDSVGNIWEIVANNSNTITTSTTAVNDGSITNVSAGNYSIVVKLIASKIVFNSNLFNIQFNNRNTLFSIGAQFNQIGTIGDEFEISEEQNNIGNLGVGVTPIAFNTATKEIRFSGAPDLQGVSSGNVLIDADGQAFNIVAIDSRSLPSTFYSEFNKSNELILTGSGLGVRYAQGFKVSTTDTYAVVSFFLTKQGNVLGNLAASIVADDGTGLPDLTSVIATSVPFSITSVEETEKIISGSSLKNNDTSAFEKATLSFTSPPTLSAGVQYHLVIIGDSSYSGSQLDGAKTFDNDPGLDGGDTAYTYTALTGVIEYASSVDLSNVETNNFFQDDSGNLFRVLSVDNSLDQITIATGLSVNDNGGAAPTTVDSGSIFTKDNIVVGVDDTSPTYTDGELARYDGIVWSNSTLGPSPFASTIDALFTVEGPKSIRIDSDLVPVLGESATISERYYDDDSQISLIIGIASGVITSASDVNPSGTGTVGGVPNSKVDNFVFRTSRFADDIVNLRASEIPRIQISDILTNIFGGVQ